MGSRVEGSDGGSKAVGLIRRCREHHVGRAWSKSGCMLKSREPTGLHARASKGRRRVSSPTILHEIRLNGGASGDGARDKSEDSSFHFICHQFYRFWLSSW